MLIHIGTRSPERLRIPEEQSANLSILPSDEELRANRELQR
jgi:hypothetical protein